MLPKTAAAAAMAACMAQAVAAGAMSRPARGSPGGKGADGLIVITYTP
jgi:hypothetical protein